MDCGSLGKKGLLQDEPTDLPTLPAITCAAFLSFVGLPSKLCQGLCLLGVIWCDLEKKSVDHGFKDWSKKNCTGVDFLLT